MRTQSGGQKFLTGIVQFLWSELRTLSFRKIKSYYNITVGFLLMKYFKRQKMKQKQLVKERQRILREQTTNQLTG